MAEQNAFLSSLAPQVPQSSAVIRQYMQQGQQQGSAKDVKGTYEGGRVGGQAISSLIGGLFRKEEGEKTGAAIRRHAKQAEDELAANIMGVTVEDMQRDRRIAKRVNEIQISDDGTPETRLRLLDEVAKVYNEEKHVEGLQAVLGQRLAVKNQIEEYNKLQGSVDKQEMDILTDGLAKGKDALTGTAIDGVLHRDENGVPGLMTADGFRAFDEDFSLYDPDTAGSMSNNPMAEIHKRLRQSTTPSFLNKLREQSSSAMSALAKSERVMDTLFKHYKDTNIESFIGDSGKTLTAVDNFVRNVRGFVKAWGASGDSEKNRTYRDSLLSGVQDQTSTWLHLIDLPEGVKAGSEKAQAHQAAIMEMAYMAARLAEPSNRGLSDKDIEAALKRIAGGTSNPQVMARRFIEMQADAAAELEHALGFFKGGALGHDVTDEMIDRAILGKSHDAYKKRKQELFDRYNVRVSSEGRVEFKGDETEFKEPNDTPQTEAEATAEGEESVEDFKKRMGL